MYKNVFYFGNINAIGGIETFFWHLARKYKDWDITILYKTGDPEQIRRLEKYVRVVQYTGQKIVCEKAFFNYNADIIDNVEAEEYNLILHADYKAQNIRPLPLYPKINHYYACSNLVRDTFEEISGVKAETLYNPFIPEKPQKVLKLISAQRLTMEKGRGRIEILARELNKANIPFVWEIFTNSKERFSSPNIILCKPKLNILNEIATADYLVQLSDTEGYSYSIVEALSVGTPVIITDIPVASEIGVVDRKNGFIVPFDMSNLPLDEIYKGLPPFEYKPREDKYGQILAKGKSTYQEELNQMVTVECTDMYWDLEKGCMPQIGERWQVNKIRAQKLLAIKGVKIVDDIS